MVALFHDMMHKEIKVYMDYMIAKSKNEEEHLVNLRKLFERLHKYQLRLNPFQVYFWGQVWKTARLYRKPERNRGGPQQGEGHP